MIAWKSFPIMKQLNLLTRTFTRKLPQMYLLNSNWGKSNLYCDETLLLPTSLFRKFYWCSIDRIKFYWYSCHIRDITFGTDKYKHIVGLSINEHEYKYLYKYTMKIQITYWTYKRLMPVAIRSQRDCRCTESTKDNQTIN